MEEFKTLLEKVGQATDTFNVDAVFGKPEQTGDRVLIPVAEIGYGFGVGFGSTEGEPGETAEVSTGGGGGLGGSARPIAYIEVGPDGTHVEPILDEQKVALAGILLSFWVVGWVGLVLKTLLGSES